MKNKTFWLIMVVIITIIAILSYYIYTMKNDKPISISVKEIINKIDNKDDDNDEDEEENKNVTEKTRKEKESNDDVRKLEKVTDYDEFFNVDAIINDYYEKLTKSDGEALLDIYDSAYIKVHKINKNNIKLYYETEYQDISFFTREMYVKGRGDINYYFVKGDTQKYDFGKEELIEGNNVYFLIIVDDDASTYSVYPLSNVSSIYNYADSYTIPTNKVIADNDHNTFFEKKYTDYTITMYYINYYRNILYMNTERAYKMLGSSTKAKYEDLESFTKDLENIYTNILGAKFSGYNATGEPGIRTYSLNSPEGISIRMVEETIMNFTIDF